MKQNPQRFSGRELGQLLAQVRDELGEDATILEANRRRDGGLAGFFAKERFEVVAASADAEPGSEHGPADGGSGPGTAPDIPSRPATADPAARQPGEPAPSAAAAGGHLDQLLHRAERVNVDEQWASQPDSARSAAVDAADPLASDRDRFGAVLRAALSGADPATNLTRPSRNGHQPSPGEASVDAPPPSFQADPARSLDAASTPPSPPSPAPGAAGSVAAGSSSLSPGPRSAGSAVPGASPRPGAAGASSDPAPPGAAVVERTVDASPPPAPGVPGAAFWAALGRFEGRVDEAPLVAGITCIVGPLDDAVAVAHSLAALAGIDQGDVVVFTDSRRVEGVPPWQLVDRRDELSDRVQYWRDNGRRALVVVELEPGERALERAARTVETTRGDLTRLVTPDLDQPARLATTLRGLGPVVAIDVSRPPRPEALIDAVEGGVRIGTVCGRPLTAMLLAGLAATTGPDHG